MFGLNWKRAVVISAVFAAPAMTLAGSRWDDDHGARRPGQDSRDSRDRDRRDDRDSRDRDSRDSRVRIDFDFRIGDRPRPREEVRRVWVEPVYRTVCDRVWVDAQYRTECDRVWREPVVETRCDKAWVPDRYEWREVAHRDHCGRRFVQQEQICVERGHWSRVERQVVVRDGFYEDVQRQVLVSEGHWQQVERQELVCAGHWEERVERVACN